MKFQIPKGLFDILPDAKDDWRQSQYWEYLESFLIGAAKSYGLQQARTPIFEKTELFTRSIGDTSDIVFKEMYNFEDKGKRSMTLRPEGTAPILRALVESRTLHENPVQKLFYLGPYFRYDRPQAGRYRQFHQFGVEVLGVKDAEQDAEVIEMLYKMFEKLGIKNLTLLLNSIGDAKSRSNYCKALQQYFEPHKSKLSDDSQERLQANPLRILDSKDSGDIELVKNAPLITEYLDSESKAHFEKLQQILDHLKIPYKLEPKLVRGLDYYNKTVFEFTTTELGAQNTIGAGGRYDGLTAQLGGQDLPAFGFAAGLERILHILIAQNAPLPNITGPEFLLIPLGDLERLKAMEIASALRLKGKSAEVYLKGYKVKNGMQYADKKRAQKVIVLGEDELKKQEVMIKDMATREQIATSFTDLID